MGLMDKLKGAVKAVTGGAAKVTIEVPHAIVLPGMPAKCRVTAISTGAELKSGGCFLDVNGAETVQVNNVVPSGYRGQAPAQRVAVDLRDTQTTFQQSFQIAPAFVLAPNETKVIEGVFLLPGGIQPSFQGKNASHQWTVRGRIEAFGNDPDSGYQPFRVGLTV